MVKDMVVIITMAGIGARFRNKGYNCPKYMIKVKGKTLFEWSMDSLIGYNSHVIKYIFVVRKEDENADFIREKCAYYGIYNIDVVELDYLTDGQATTCKLAISHCNPTDAIMVYNIDTYVEPLELRFEDISGDGYIPCFHAKGDHWSFVKLDENKKAIEVQEKVRISNNCTIGAYYFSSAELFNKLYNEYYLNNKIEKNEKYIAPLYNLMIQKGMLVTISIINSQKVHVLGTPEELQIFQENDD